MGKSIEFNVASHHVFVDLDTTYDRKFSEEGMQWDDGTW